MEVITTNLYPPIVKDFIPAFIIGTTCRIYFSIYDDISDIKGKNQNGNIQISLISQKTNQSILNPTTYPSGIKLADFQTDENIKDDYKYYIEIAPSDLNSTGFVINQFYMVQLRLIDKNAQNAPIDGKLDTWLYNNRNYFSEWSKTCLIKGISTPSINIKNFKAPFTYFVGTLKFQNEEEKEQLKSYNIIISNNVQGQVVKSKEIYTYSSNEINYEITYDFSKDTEYTLTLTYTTNNLYEGTFTQNFQLPSSIDNKLDCSITAIPEEDNGRIKINIDFKNTIVFTDSDLIIKRASYKTNFRIWEIVKTIPHTINSLQHIWYDTTVENGVWYKYRVYDIEEVKVRQIEKPIICMFEDIFLTNKDKQLKIQFNPSISGYKYNVTESQQVTLGAQYPFVRRNGNNFFRTFSIGGLISSFMDENDWYDPNFYDGGFHIKNELQPFTSRQEIYGDFKQLYNNYDRTYESYIYEREFRKKVSDFLYENNVKLFRSMTQGNILVKLMDISLQPMNELGRKLYSFSASATEIDDSIISSYLDYNIINKYYYTYKVRSLEELEEDTTFQSEESIVSKITSLPGFLNTNEELLKIVKINIQLKDPTIKPVLYVKLLNNEQPIRYIIDSGFLSLQFNDDMPVQDCYFYGIHLEEGTYHIQEGYYTDINSIDNPQNNTVYQITTTGSSDDFYIISNYVNFNQNILTLDPTEVERHDTKYTLIAERDTVKRYYYENEEWIPFSSTGEELIDIQADIKYYYQIKGVN